MSKIQGISGFSMSQVTRSVGTAARNDIEEKNSP